MADETPYQQTAQVDQLLAERENAVAYEQQTRVDAVDKQLDGLGVSARREAAAEKRKTAAEKAEDGGESKQAARSAPPQGRQSKPQQST